MASPTTRQAHARCIPNPANDQMRVVLDEMGEQVKLAPTRKYILPRHQKIKEWHSFEKCPDKFRLYEL
jgi:hypothetical protein